MKIIIMDGLRVQLERLSPCSASYMIELMPVAYGHDGVCD
jgi:hypothetical protein